MLAVHEERLCLGDPLEVRRKGGRIEVIGLVRNEEQKQALLARLAPLELANLLTTRVQTLEEALKENEQTRPASLPHAGPRDILVHATARPLDDLLMAYFRQVSQDNPAGLARRVIDFSNRAVSLAEAALSEAWALRRIREQFPPERIANLDLQSARLLERLAGEHLAALSEELARATALWQGPLGGLGLGERPEAELVGEHRGDDLFGQVSEYHALVHALLAGAGELSDPVPRSLERLGHLMQSSLRLARTLDARLWLRGGSPIAKDER